MIAQAIAQIADAPVTDAMARNATRLLAMADATTGRLVIRYEDLAELFGVASIDVVRKYLRRLAEANLVSWQSAGGIFYVGFIAFVPRVEVSRPGHFPAQSGHKGRQADETPADLPGTAKWSPWAEKRPLQDISRPVEDSYARPTNGL